MRPIDKTSEDLFQKLRSRFSPISMGNEQADETADPAEARIFNFMYKEDDSDENDKEVGYVSISIIDNRSFKIYYGTDLVDRIENKNAWYAFLKEMRMFAKRNLMSFDARDLAKNQLEPRDFKFISQQDGTYKEHEVTVSESVMFGSRRKSYQTMENVKMIVHHRKSIDETIPGSRSRYIESIFLERADGERYKFPYNYLTGARAMARHVNEGGTPYDDMGKHIVGMIKEMRDLSKFARRTKKHAMEDENAGNIRNSVVERFHNMKKQLGAMSVKEGYARFIEGFKADEALVEDDAVQQIKERFTQQVFDTQLEDTLPAVMKAIKEAEMKQIAEADKSIPHLIKSKPLVLRKDSAADQMFRSTKFTDGAGLLSFILSDIASRAIGDSADEIANFASDAAERVQDKDYDPKDKQTAMMLAKKYMDDVKKMTSDPSYADEVRVDPKNVYGKMKKREGGFHESEQYEAWANELVPEDYDSKAADEKQGKLYGKKIHKQAVKDDPINADWHKRVAKGYGDEAKRLNKKSVTGMEEETVSEISNKAKMDYVNKGMDWATNRTHSSGNPDPDTKLGKRIDNIQKTVSSLPKKKSDVKNEATTQGTTGTTGTSGPAALAQNLKDPNLIKQSKLAAQALKTGGVQNVNAQTVAKTLGKQASSMPLNRKDMEPVSALGAKAMQAATNPKVANQLGALLKKAGI